MAGNTKVEIHEHYNVEHPRSKAQSIDISAEINHKTLNKTVFLELKSSSSIFSKNKVDLGTMHLLTYGDFTFDKDAKVLDLGCGYGVIGIALKKLYPKYDVVLSDLNRRAVELSKKNAKSNNADVKVIQSDLFFKLKDKFDIIVSNPPYIAGKDFIKSLIEESYKHLNNNGYIELVVMYNKGGKSIEKLMLDIFGNVDTIAKKSGYRIIKSIKQ